MIQYQHVTVAVEGPEGKLTLLENINTELGAARTAVIGENGSGKSTFAKVLAGLVKYTGSVQLDGVEVASNPKKLRNLLGMIVPNAATQVIMPTVAEDVALSLRGSGLNKTQQAQKVASALDDHELTELAERSCFSLSSGQLQRLALCAVLIGEPRVLLADEPTSMLDARHQRIVANRLFSLPETQLVLVTHDMELAARCDEAVWISKGRIAGHGVPAEIIERYLKSLEEPV